MSPLKQYTFVAIGLTTTSMGIIGAFVPGLPTTVFVIIALWAFSKSSQQLSAWLKAIPILKGAILEAEEFHLKKTIALKVKLIACSFATASFILILITTPKNALAVKVMVGLLALSCYTTMLYFPTRTPLQPHKE